MTYSSLSDFTAANVRQFGRAIFVFSENSDIPSFTCTSLDDLVRKEKTFRIARVQMYAHVGSNTKIEPGYRSIPVITAADERATVEYDGSVLIITAATVAGLIDMFTTQLESN